jgi:hypothetical protein
MMGLRFEVSMHSLADLGFVTFRVIYNILLLSVMVYMFLGRSWCTR